jgi:LysR family glycine cleavage system transcriptional activator
MALRFRDLPPARALAILDAAARLLNFSAAGRELNLSQAAVSKQVQALEASLGVKLFTRSNRGLTVTAAGKRLHQGVSIGLGHIVEALDEVRPRYEEVTITTTIALASIWLMSRIAKFRAEHPGIDLRVIATDAILDLAGDRVDIALRYGLGQWAGTSARRLFVIDLFPVCSPEFLVRQPKMKTVEDVLRTTLLHVDEPNSRDADWSVWAKTVGATFAAPAGGLHFNNYPLLIQAALNGQGVALGWGHVIGDLLANGSLVQCLPTRLLLKPAFFLLTSDSGYLRPEVSTFADWIFNETESLRGDESGGRFIADD